jgi:predicted membrane-bound spermidine synthase
LNTIFVLILGAVAGLSTCLNLLSGSGKGIPPLRGISGSLFLALSAGAFAVLGIRFLTRRLIRGFAERKGIWKAYIHRDSWCYAAFLLSFSGGLGVQISVPIIYLSVLAFCFGQCALVLHLIKGNPRNETYFASVDWVSFLFLVSGMAALIYEIAWQRVLFAEYGINIESVTIIVSLFMFGLGIGSLAGGWVSKRFPRRLPHLFILCELAIGSFGVISVPLIKMVAKRTLDLPLPGVTISIYALLALPTVFMGGTLPILVTYLHRHYRHVGHSVAKLYFFNTIGSALASLITVDLLFVFMGLQTVVFAAAALNFSVAFLVYRYMRSLDSSSGAEEDSEKPEVRPDPHGPLQSIPFPTALLIAGVAGYVSLSQEILWVRAISFATAAWPQIFGHILGFFLLGVALGAVIGKRFSGKRDVSPLGYLAMVFFLGSLAYFLSIPVFAQVFTFSRGLGILASYVVLALVACLFGSVLPLLSHFAIRPGAPVGVSLSRIYVANIIGSTAGPLFTGFYLMERFSLEKNALIISLIGMGVAGILFSLGPGRPAIRIGRAAGVAATIAVAFFIHPRIFHQVLEKMQYDENYSEARGFKYVNQNRSGIITIEADRQGDAIYGGGGYDGRFNVDPVSDANIIRRVYMVPALHPDPAEVLEIGLSGGSWAWVLARHPDIRKMDVVEINPGYIPIIRNYEVNREILSDPRIAYHYDDGRRWLNRHPEKKFDFILMNTTWHWRSNSTNLLSEEFLSLAKRHLKTGGVIYYNSTHSDDVVYTAAKVFKHIAIYNTFVAAGDAPFGMDEARKRARLLMFTAHGKPIFDTADAASNRVLEEMLGADISDKKDSFLARKDLTAITDDNMLTEFRKITGKDPRDIKGRLYRWYNPDAAWFSRH